MPTIAIDGVEYELNLIDTPGHVDFHYEGNSLVPAVSALVIHSGRNSVLWTRAEILPGDRRLQGGTRGGVTPQFRYGRILGSRHRSQRTRPR